MAKILIYDQARVNGGRNYEYPEQRWVPYKVFNIDACRARDSGNQADLIELKVQTKDRRESVNIKVCINLG